MVQDAPFVIAGLKAYVQDPRVSVQDSVEVVHFILKIDEFWDESKARGSNVMNIVEILGFSQVQENHFAARETKYAEYAETKIADWP